MSCTQAQLNSAADCVFDAFFDAFVENGALRPTDLLDVTKSPAAILRDPPGGEGIWLGINQRASQFLDNDCARPPIESLRNKYRLPLGEAVDVYVSTICASSPGCCDD